MLPPRLLELLPESRPVPIHAFTIGLALVLSIAYYSSSRGKQHRYPPGPRGLPIVGNALQIWPDRQWLQWAEWARVYGPIIHLTVLGQPTIVLSTLKGARDLLETRGSIYSDRPAAVMAGELVGWNRGLGYSNANARFREFRRAFHAFMGPRAVEAQAFRASLEQENLRLLSKLLTDPGNFDVHTRECTSSTILLMSYGYPSHTGDPLGLVDIAEDAMHGFAVASEPGRWWVDSFPLLKHLPPSIASFQRTALEMREVLDRLYDLPFNFVKAQMETPTHLPSFMSTYLEDSPDRDPELAKAAGASLYSGGAETTPSALNSFILAMTLYPDVQRRAQAEVDRVCFEFELGGGRRLPCIGDKGRMPYVEALMREVWRWNPSVPLGLPHVASQTDTYMGYTIEKGTVVWANIWAMMHDEEMFPDAARFEPSRFLASSSSSSHDRDLSEAVVKERIDAVESSFGFGRRICPGLYLASSSVFLAIATILATFDIAPVVGEDLPKVEYDGFISHPRPFKCTITPRSEAMKELVLDELARLDEQLAST